MDMNVDLLVAGESLDVANILHQPGPVPGVRLAHPEKRLQTHAANQKGQQQMNTGNRLTLVLVTGLLGTASLSPSADCSWTRKTSTMPTPRSLLSACAVEGRIYAIGGGRPSAVLYSAVEQYDPATDTWTKKAAMPTPRTAFGLGVVDGKIYAIGGCLNAYDSSDLSSMEAYDPATDNWSRMADMPAKRKGFGSAAVNGRIYVVGGVSQGGWDPALSIVEEYNPKPTATHGPVTG